jgi:hypothetical protein
MGANTPKGVICQKIKIQTPQKTIERIIYRDPQGKRRPRPQKVVNDEAQLSDKFALAAVSWSAPLSATDYQNWHDSQHVRRDRIARVGHHMLELTTTVPNGSVAEQSLMVRESDFHPVQRTVVFRDSETVEIAELSYDVFRKPKSIRGCTANWRVAIKYVCSPAIAKLFAYTINAYRRATG